MDVLIAGLHTNNAKPVVWGGQPNFQHQPGHGIASHPTVLNTVEPRGILSKLGAGRYVTKPHTLYSILYTLHPTPYTLHPTLCTLHPTPYTLHPTPYTLHPISSTLNLTFQVLNPKSSTLKPAPGGAGVARRAMERKASARLCLHSIEGLGLGFGM